MSVYYLNPAAAQFENLFKKRDKLINQLATRSMSVFPQGGKTILKLNKPVKLGNQAVGSTVLLATNTKMKCPTFTLPAGRPALGGTCPAEALSDKAEPGFVCNGCYAGKGQYNMWPSIPISQALKQLFVIVTLQSGTFVSEMTDAISLLYESGQAEKMGKQAKYVFRLHDSGDFFSVEYLSAWLKVCEYFQAPNRKILFWAPTRMWYFPQFRKLMGQAPGNLVIRPSGLYIDGPVPDMGNEFIVGSTVNTPGPSPGTFANVGGSNCWICPAYAKAEVKGEKEASCESTNCRRCWGKKDHVSYTEH